MSGRRAKAQRREARRYVKERLAVGQLVAKARVKPCPWWCPPLLWRVFVKTVLKDVNRSGTAMQADLKAPGPTFTYERMPNGTLRVSPDPTSIANDPTSRMLTP